MGQVLFPGADPSKGITFDPHLQLAQMVDLLDRPPKALLERGANTAEYFDMDGK